MGFVSSVPLWLKKGGVSELSIDKDKLIPYDYSKKEEICLYC